MQQALLKILEGTVANVPPQGGRKHPQQKNIEVNTKDILFICGGAFEGLEKIVERRVGQKAMGFGADIKSKKERNIGELLALVEPEDLLRYGLIPELVGRLPVTGVLDSLDKASLIEILTKPKNAIAKQYQKFFEMEGVKLEFTEDGLEAVAELALRRGTGARGLRAVLEEGMLDLMYEIPSRLEVVGCTITRDVIEKKAQPILAFRMQRLVGANWRRALRLRCLLMEPRFTMRSGSQLARRILRAMRPQKKSLQAKRCLRSSAESIFRRAVSSVRKMSAA